MMMPGMDGPTATQKLRALNPDIKIIGFSGLASSRDSAEIAGIHFQRFLPKPFSAADLLQSLQEVLNENSGA